MARPAPIALCVALLLALVAFATPSAHADGKVFLSASVIPTDSSGSATMPRQRAIIAFQDGVQHLAIDTAFVGPGEEFAWLIPLPSEPEILPATEGTFDAAAMITGPRVRTWAHGYLLSLGVALLVICMIGVVLNTPRLPIFVLLLVVCLFHTMMMGLARGGGSSGHMDSMIDVHSRQSVGIYETVVLSASHARDVVDWLQAEGFGAPAEVESVMQDYLDRGWVFAAAKIRGGEDGEAEQNPHPLRFRFESDQPVYPMALTAIGNQAIQLDLFVFADGSASATHFVTKTSLPTRSADYARGPNPSRRSVSLLLQRPVTIANPGLVEIAGGLSFVTHLRGELSAEQQREDIKLVIGEAKLHDPLLRTREAKRTIVLTVGAWIACAVIFGWLVLTTKPVSRQRIRSRGLGATLKPLTIAAMVGVLGSGVLWLVIPAYAGTSSNQRDLAWEVYMFSTMQERIDGELFQRPAPTRETIEGTIQKIFERFEFVPRVGDSPAHYRIEFKDDDTEARFIWHDLIGAEHRVVIPLAADASDEPTP
jgi:hypothetical protein